MVRYSHDVWNTFNSHSKDWWKIVAAHHHENVLTRYRPANAWLHTYVTYRDRIRLHCRYQRDLLIYDGCMIPELRRFCSDRGITAAKDVVDKRRLISILEAADETATFDRFLNLPAELRVRIYEEHFSSMPPKTSYGKEREETLSRDFCVEPPILQVCQLIRHEATTVWYDMTRFNLDIGLLTANEELDDPIDSPEVVDAIADRFFIDAPAEMIARVRKLRISSSCDYTRAPRRGTARYTFVWTIDLETPNKPSKVLAVEAREPKRVDFVRLFWATSQFVEARLEKWAERLEHKYTASRLGRYYAWDMQEEISIGVNRGALLAPSGWRLDPGWDWWWNWY